MPLMMLLMVLLMVLPMVLAGCPAAKDHHLAAAKDHLLAAAAAAKDRLLNMWMQYLSLTPSVMSRSLRYGLLQVRDHITKLLVLQC